MLAQMFDQATAPACNGWVRMSTRNCGSEVLHCSGKGSFAQNFVTLNFCCIFSPLLDHPSSPLALCHLSSDSLSSRDKVADCFCHFSSWFSLWALFWFLILSLWWILYRTILFRRIWKGSLGTPKEHQSDSEYAVNNTEHWTCGLKQRKRLEHDCISCAAACTLRNGCLWEPIFPS